MLFYTVSSLAWVLVVGTALRSDPRHNVIRQVAPSEAITCQFLHQKELGLCGTSTGVPTQITTTPNIEYTGPPSTPVETTAVWESSLVAQPALTTSTTVQEGITKEVVIINGGPLTSPITLPPPLPTKLDPSATEVRSSISSISSDVSIALSTVTAWLTQPEQPRASEAIKAVEPLVSIVGGLTYNIPGGVMDTTCSAISSGESTLARNLSSLMCRLLDVLRGLRTGLISADPAQIDSATSAVRSGSEEVAAQMSSAAANNGDGGSGTSTTPTGVTATTTSPTMPTPTRSSTELALHTTNGASSQLTLTKVPELAVFQTLTEVTYTTPTYITTTSPGSDQPTIVPVIIPFSGPPRICFGCYLSFPPNIAISVPEFCIQLFGLNIGSCPPSSDGDGKDEDKDEEDEKSESQSSATPTSSSCTTAITATHASVFCSVTKEYSTDGKQPKTLGCSTAAFTTVTGCSVQNSATTSTTELSSPTPWLCSQPACGQTGCAASDKKTRQLSSWELQKRGDPQEGVWPDPSDYSGNQDAFMAGETWEIAFTNTDYDSKMVKLTGPKHGDHLTSHNWISFKDNVGALSVRGLYGCTSVVVLSHRGAFASHIWEPAFSSQNEKYFTDRAITGLHGGAGPGKDLTEFKEYGIDDLRYKPDDGDRGIIFGDGTPDDNDLPIQVFIFTPRIRPPDSAPDNVRLDPNYMAGTRLYDSRVQELREHLVNTFTATSTQVKVDIVDYAPRTILSEWSGESADTIRAKLLDNEIEESRGKLLIQYQPAPDCTGKASWRLWVEGRQLEGRTASWDPASNQIFQGQAAGGAAAKRQACPVRSATPGGTSSEPSQQMSRSASVPTTTRPIETLTPSSEPAKTTSSPPKTTTSPAVEETTTAPPPPESTTSTEAPPPKSTEQVLIEFALEKASPSEPGQPPSLKGSWVMFLKKADDASRRECDDKRVGLKAISNDGLDSVWRWISNGGGEESPEDWSWPPAVEAYAGVDIAGRKGCKYNEKKDGPGSFVCDEKDRDEKDCDEKDGDEKDCDKKVLFNCIKDEQSDGAKICGGSPQITYYPKVRCLLPVA